jgi:toxin ParE1/3/4
LTTGGRNFNVPTRFRVEISGGAKRDIQAIHDVIAKDKPQAAAKWARMIYQKARSLNRLPFRCEVIPEVENMPLPFRHLLHGKYRIIYLVDEDEKLVVVIGVIRGNRILRPRYLDFDPPSASS